MIPHELVKMNANLPSKLSKLAEDEPEIALSILRSWGEGTKTLRVLWKEVTSALDALSA